MRVATRKVALLQPFKAEGVTLEKHAYKQLIGGVIWHRSHASAAQQEQSGMKKHLRELYKRVHPDRFHSHPVARDANEKSFKLLQEYLSEAQEGGTFAGIAGVPYRFVFYLRQNPGTQRTRLATSITEEEGLYKVGVTLPPPGRLHQFPGSEIKSPSAHRAIGGLLSACGLQTDLEEESEYASDFDRQSFTAERLREFIPRAAHIMQQNEAGRVGPLEHLRLAQTALRMGRQVTAEFLDEARFLSTEDKAQKLQQLAACLDKLPEHISGLQLLLGKGYGMDSLGRVRLQSQDGPNLWAGFLMQVDLEGCRDRQRTIEQLRALERSAAASLGLSLVCTRSHLTLDPAYQALLLQLVAAGKERPPVFTPVAKGLVLLVKGAESDPSRAQSMEGCDVSDQDGLFSVPMNADSITVFALCEKHGRRMQEAVTRKLAAADELNELRHQTERRMRLRKLVLDSSVAPAHLRECCLRLTQATDTLKTLLDGLSVRISHTNQVSANGDSIDIAWNFQV